jgi:hypothetical protein
MRQTIPYNKPYRDGPGFFGWLFRFLVILVILGGLGFLAFAYVGDLSREPEPRRIELELGDA